MQAEFWAMQAEFWTMQAEPVQLAILVSRPGYADGGTHLLVDHMLARRVVSTRGTDCKAGRLTGVDSWKGGCTRWGISPPEALMPDARRQVMTRYPSFLVFVPETQHSAFVLIFSVQKARSSQSQQKRFAEVVLSAYIAVIGSDSPMPCSNCFHSQRSCVIAPGSKCCGECISRKVACDGDHFASALLQTLEDYKTLEREEDELQERLLSVMRRKRRAKTRADELFRRGMVDHEKDVPDPRGLPAPESQASMGGQAQSSSAAVGSPDWLAGVDWSSVDPDLLLGQAGQGSVGGTAGASPGSSGAREVPTS
ncbi:hypothetical protein QBC37DRAFT_401398 [Rhypophila decipiens]|uniref:Uncharacterized protein n=1 Tax=Rhypophila decipiens TaxID=261697 RepID=A0AAN6Y9L7_9PEZI|nr:hypothetical protein QBC37DRAFT_401398 [Rhypophila decipiens]